MGNIKSIIEDTETPEGSMIFDTKIVVDTKISQIVQSQGYEYALSLS